MLRRYARGWVFGPRWFYLARMNIDHWRVVLHLPLRFGVRNLIVLGRRSSGPRFMLSVFGR